MNKYDSLILKEKKASVSRDEFDVFYCDFESVLKKNRHFLAAYCIIGLVTYFSILPETTNYENLEEESSKLAEDFIKNCFLAKRMTKKHKNRKSLFYFHNLGKFDSYFILELASRFSKYKPTIIIRNNVIYKIELYDYVENDFVEFRDSYLLLPISLEKIGEIFCKSNKKTSFDHTNVTIEMFSDKRFRQKLRSYCINDTLILEEGFLIFHKEILKLLKINICHRLTLPSVATACFFQEYYVSKNTPIERLNETKDFFIRKSYKGGIVDILGDKLYNGFHYDINSLYPYCMTFEMPLNRGEFVKGNSINLTNFFGFIKTKVISPKNLKIPFLCINENKRGLIAPCGEFEGTFFSEELKYAAQLGYLYEFIEGIEYKRGLIFDTFIKYIYELRIQSSINTPRNTILKLILNSFYGRFGMRPHNNHVIFIEKNEEILRSYLSKYVVLDYEEINNKYMIKFTDEKCESKIKTLLMENKISYEEYLKLTNKSFYNSLNSMAAVQIASATTAYARIEIHKYKSKEEIGVIYSDTDSIFCAKELPENDIGKNLGQMKLVEKIKKGVFVAPKLYFTENDQNQTKIRCKGVPSEYISTKNIEDLADKKSTQVKIEYENLFFRNFSKLSITVENKKFSLNSAENKQLFNQEVLSNLINKTKLK